MAVHGKVVSINGLEEKTMRDWENGFLWFSDPARMNKLIADYELYKMILELPGDVMQMGVFQGAALIRWASFRQILENDSARKLSGFDAFGAFPTKGVSLDLDLDFIHAFEAKHGQGLAKRDLQNLLLEKGFSNVDLIEGDVLETLPHYVQSNPANRIALLHLDMAAKEPTQFVLAALYDRVVPGGLIVIDDYMEVSGVTEAIDDLIATKGLKIEKLSFSAMPAFIRKPEPVRGSGAGITRPP